MAKSQEARAASSRERTPDAKHAIEKVFLKKSSSVFCFKTIWLQATKQQEIEKNIIEKTKKNFRQNPKRFFSHA